MTTPIEDRPDLLKRRLAREQRKLLHSNYCPACNREVGDEPHACHCPDCQELVQDDVLPHKCKPPHQRWWSRPGAQPPLTDDPRAAALDRVHPTFEAAAGEPYTPRVVAHPRRV